MSSSSSSDSELFEGRSVLVVGSDGLIGSAVMEGLRARGAGVTGTTRRVDQEGTQWDLAREGIPEALVDREFDLVVIAAGVTTLEACESDPQAARTVNVERPLEICRRWGRSGTRVVGLSTSLVFDGETQFPEPTDATRPVTEYGRQKESMEDSMLREGTNVVILRLTKVVSPDWSRLVEWRGRLSRGLTVPAFSDTGFSPVLLSDVVSSILTLSVCSGNDVVHLSARDEISYFDFAESIRQSRGLEGKVKPISALGSRAFRRYATLGTATQLESLPGAHLTAEVVVRAMLQ
jgi:dTDP-4-dehydrorhamnose reductase